MEYPDPGQVQEELRKMAINIIDQALSQFHDYADEKPGKPWTLQEKINLRTHFMEHIVDEIKIRG